MSPTYDDTMRRISDEITRYRAENFREPRQIELADADYDAVAAMATYDDGDADGEKPKRSAALTDPPRDGDTMFNVPVRANSALRHGQIKLT